MFHRTLGAAWLPFVLAALGALVFSGPPTVARAQPTGSVAFSGPGAALLPSPTFIPYLFSGDEDSWAFFDESGVVGVVVVELTGNPSLASLVSVTVEGGATWLQFSFSGVMGVSISGDTIDFKNVVLPQGAPALADNLVMDGSLTRPTVSVSSFTWGRIKSLFREGNP